MLAQVNVPSAHMEEILPAARLLSRATAVTPLDYERAKAAFLAHMQRAGVASAELSRQVSGSRRTPPGLCSELLCPVHALCLVPGTCRSSRCQAD